MARKRVPMSNLNAFASEILLNFGQVNARRNTQRKADGSEVTDTDTSIEARFREKFPDLPVVGEEGKPVKDGKKTFRTIDPVDGTALLARGQDRWNLAISEYLDGVPVVSVAAGWGIRAQYRVLDARNAIDFENLNGSLQSHQGYLLSAGHTETCLEPLYTTENPVTVNVHPVVPVPLSSRSTLLVVPLITLPTTFVAAGIRTVTAESSVGAQVEVILGMADACILGPETSLHLNPDQPSPYLWDLIPRAVHNAGLVYVRVTGPGAPEIVEIQDLLAFCDINYKLTEQLLVCHPTHVSGLIARLHILRSMLKLS